MDGWPPEVPVDEGDGLADFRVEGEFYWVNPMNESGTDSGAKVDLVREASTRIIQLSFSDDAFDFLCENSNRTDGWKDESQGFILGVNIEVNNHLHCICFLWEKDSERKKNKDVHWTTYSRASLLKMNS